MKIRLIRHATLVLNINGYKILVDPMLGAKGAYAPIPNLNVKRNPTIELHIEKQELESIINGIDAVLVTHLHNDHFDVKAQEILPKEIPMICQPEDASRLKELGYKEVYPVKESIRWKEISFIRTGGQHGTGCTALKMAPVSGFIIKASEEPSLYIAGDTIWCEEVNHAINLYAPSIVVVNAGAAKFLTGDPITMGTYDIIKVCERSPQSRIIAVHMEALNHCGLTRDKLKKYLSDHKLINKVVIPEDGEELEIKE